MKWLLLLITSLSFIVPAFGQDAQTPAEKEAAYTRTINTRAQKIVATLGISDESKANRVTTIIADQYRNLNHIHTIRDEQLKKLKTSAEEKEKIAASIKETEDHANTQLGKLHTLYLSQLATELTTAQIEQVKDGMTYGVLPITYKGYLDMIPRLTTEQKEQIMQWLTEAREHAMDAESSEKKHWWFGKYKGRINNYLSAAGYDMKKEGEEWQKRIKARESEKKNVQN